MAGRRARKALPRWEAASLVAWSTSALAQALGSSQRTVQRALVALQEAGQVRALGRGRSQRWLSAPVAGFATTLLLPDSGGFG